LTGTTGAGTAFDASAIFAAGTAEPAGGELGASTRAPTSGPAALPPAAADSTTMTAVEAKDRASRPWGIGNFSRTARHAELTGNFSRTVRQFSRTICQAELNCILPRPPPMRRMVKTFDAVRKPESQARFPTGVRLKTVSRAGSEIL
jgi:hypothetical protein